MFSSHNGQRYSLSAERDLTRPKVHTPTSVSILSGN
jgi:hypothetical protein